MCLPSQPFISLGIVTAFAGLHLGNELEKSKEGKAIEFARVLSGTLKRKVQPRILIHIVPSSEEHFADIITLSCLCSFILKLLQVFHIGISPH